MCPGNQNLSASKNAKKMEVKMKGEFIKKKFFSMALSMLTAITMSCSVLLIMPVSNQAAYSLWERTTARVVLTAILTDNLVGHS